MRLPDWIIIHPNLRIMRYLNEHPAEFKEQDFVSKFGKEQWKSFTQFSIGPASETYIVMDHDQKIKSSPAPADCYKLNLKGIRAYNKMMNKYIMSLITICIVGILVPIAVVIIK